MLARFRFLRCSGPDGVPAAVRGGAGQREIDDLNEAGQRFWLKFAG